MIYSKKFIFQIKKIVSEFFTSNWLNQFCEETYHVCYLLSDKIGHDCDVLSEQIGHVWLSKQIGYISRHALIVHIKLVNIDFFQFSNLNLTP